MGTTSEGDAEAESERELLRDPVRDLDDDGRVEWLTDVVDDELPDLLEDKELEGEASRLSETDGDGERAIDDETEGVREAERDTDAEAEAGDE